MSGKNNVNPGQYKVGGRERPDVMAKERMKDTRHEVVRNSADSKPSRKPTKRR